MQCRWRNTGQSTVDEHNSSPYRLWNSEDSLVTRSVFMEFCGLSSHFLLLPTTDPKHAWHTHTYIHIQTHAHIHRHKCRLTKANPYQWAQLVESSWNVMAHGDAREGKWRENWRMEWIANTLHTTSEHGVSNITTADAHTSFASSRLNWRPPPI
jgi:hypothetical protein